MGYKSIIRSREARLKLLKLLNFVPDSWMVRYQYRIKTGRRLNLQQPTRYTEKIQWYKLYYRDPLMIQCSDKAAVREYVQSKGFEHILNDCYGIYKDVDELDFNSFPGAFVLKFNNGSGVNHFVHDRSKVKEDEVKSLLAKSIRGSNVKSGREWGYFDIQPRILVEKLLERDENNDIPDYKFFCFGGRVAYLYVMKNYVDDHNLGRCSFFTREFQKLPFRRSEYLPIEDEVEKPENFDQMISIAESLALDFPHVRVDLYNMRGKIVFGELTFYPASGYSVFYPDEFYFIL